jgi:hypothetical protein
MIDAFYFLFDSLLTGKLIFQQNQQIAIGGFHDGRFLKSFLAGAAATTTSLACTGIIVLIAPRNDNHTRQQEQ